MQSILSTKIMGTALIITAALAVMFTTLSVSYAQGPGKNQCDEAHARALANGNGNKYGLLKHDNCP